MLSKYCLCPSANNVSNANELLPLPLGPVMTTSFRRGNSRETFFRLWVRAPWIRIGTETGLIESSSIWNLTRTDLPLKSRN